MKIEVVTEPGAEWDEFALGSPGVQLGHASAWARVYRQAYRLEPLYLTARAGSGGALRGVLPLVAMRGLRGGRELVSLPFLDAAGPLADDDATIERLVGHACALARERGASAVELRRIADAGAPPSPLDRVDLVLELAPDPDAQWKALRAKVRNQTRKAEREGLSLLDGTRATLLDAFYGPFAINMRDLGSPVHARRFFATIADAFADRMRFVVTGLDGRPIGGLVAIAFGDTVTIPWASTLRSERSRCPNNQIYWEGIRWAVEQGAARLDFGRSPRDGGTHRFKRGWGAEERELDWRRLGADGEPLATGVSAGAGSLLQALSRVWTRLPVLVATRLGPTIRRRLSN